MALPKAAAYVVIGAGVHGLSTAWHLAMELERLGKGSGKDVVLIDKTGAGAGASGIACGCVRNMYMTTPIHAILRHSVDVWMYDPVDFGFQQVGYISAGEANQIHEYETIHKSQNAVGYHSDLYEGKDAKAFLKKLWPDFKVDGIDVALHEKLSGYAGTHQVMWGLSKKCEQYGVNLQFGVEVTGYETGAGGTVTKVRTSAGTIACDAVVWGLGAWTPLHWKMLGKAEKLDLRYADGHVAKDRDMWTYWRLLEGEVYHDEPYRTADGRDPPVLHVELMSTPVRNEQGKELADHLYVYWKNGAERMDRSGIQGGTIPIKLGANAKVEPYGHANDEYQAEAEFADYLTAAMAQLMGRFEGHREKFRERRNGGIGAFTPDNVPIFDWVAPNLFMLADSNHGFKMLGAGKLAARLLVGGNRVPELEPFAFERFAKGRTFGATNSNSPWV